jgi:hypothetical protein
MSDTSLLVLNFEGLDGATTWTEEVDGLTPYESGVGFKLTTSTKKFGSSSLEFEGDGVTEQEFMAYYPLPTVTGDITIHGWITIKDGKALWIGSGSENETSIDPFSLASVSNGNSFILFTLGSTEFSPGVRQLFMDTILNCATTGNSLRDQFSITNPFPVEGIWYHVAFVVSGQYYNIAIDGNFQETWGRAYDEGPEEYVDNPFAGIDAYGISTYNAQPGVIVCWDAWEVLNYAKWTEDFTPPTKAPGYLQFPTLSILPTYPLKEDREDSVIRTKPEEGYQITRRKYSREKRKFTLEYKNLTQTDKDLLTTFFDTTVGIIKPFSWTNPSTSALHTVTFTRPMSFNLDSYGGGGYKYSTTVELQEQ